MALHNFYAALRAAWNGAEAKPCLTLPDGRTFSYGEVDALSARMAGALLAAGARPGDRVLVQVEKSPENVGLYLGAMRAGLVYVPLNTAYTTNEVAYFLNDAEPAVFVCTPERENALGPIAKAASAKTVLTLDAKGGGTFGEAIKNATPFDDVQTRHEQDLAVILYTSGTTGRSKGAMLTHNNLSSNARALNTLWGFTQEDVLLHALPIYHIHGLFVALHTAMLSACEMLFLPKFDAAGVMARLSRATVMMGVPTFYSRLLAEPGFSRETCAHMRLFISGSAPLTEAVFNEFEARTGHRILERYGMSEAGMIASNPLDGERVAGTVGYALPDVSVRIANDDGKPAPAGTPGNVEVKGPNVFKGYWNNLKKTAEAFTPDDYFKTGDIGALDETGRLTLMGRSKDLIIAGGFNIYPKEIEQVLDAVPGVIESAVIGVPHPDMGEGVVAVLVGEPDAAAMEAALAGLARFKRPRKFFRVDALPRNAMGKVEKQRLRETYDDAYTRPPAC